MYRITLGIDHFDFISANAAFHTFLKVAPIARTLGHMVYLHEKPEARYSW